MLGRGVEQVGIGLRRGVQRYLVCGFGAATTVGEAGWWRLLVCHTRRTRSGRSRPSGRSLFTQSSAAVTVAIGSETQIAAVGAEVFAHELADV